MTALIEAQMAAMSLIEGIAVVFAIGYLVLAIRQSIWCWPCAFVSTGLYVYLFGDVNLYMESALNAFYLLMAIYGFYSWSRGTSEKAPLPVVTLPLQVHIAAGVIIVFLVAMSAYVLTSYTAQALPVVDAFTTWTAVWATWLTAKKVLENWWYWLVVDVVSVALYFERGLPLTGLLFIGYVFMIPMGYFMWRRSWHASGAMRVTV